MRLNGEVMVVMVIVTKIVMMMIMIASPGAK